MTEEPIYEFVTSMIGRGGSFSVTFLDGDTYWLDDLDPCKSLDSDEEPIAVRFSDCFELASAYKSALLAGYLQTTGVLWGSDEPHEPIGMTYYPEDVLEIKDTGKDYVIYRKDET